MPDILSTPADGNSLTLFVPTLADPTKPKLTELSAGTAVDLSCYLTGDGFTPSLDEQTIEDTRMCSTQDYEVPGRSKNGLTVKYIDNSNSPNATTMNKAVDTLLKGTTGFLVTRFGKPYTTALAVGDKVTVRPITAMTQNELPPEANSVFKVEQKLAITGPVQRKVAVVA
ncbi:hypothetical protein [Arthrobacter woluwensis]|uniref:phage tail tube protein n=1 Tax=Arthrobacter woluwensis TaxID=156980 RepID=UPI001AAE3168|nr:hypothetical protein [Arthrobacter woluwensis]QTF70612.1 hypothetical protein G8758_00230 [Arthrobacter woluwensis]